jgi:hypothetical protein
MPENKVIVGLDGDTLIGPAGAVATTSMGDIKKASATLEKEVVESVKRGHSGWKDSRPTTKKITMELTFAVYDTDSNGVIQTILDAALADTPIAILDKISDSGKKIDADFHILSCNKVAENENEVTYDVSLQSTNAYRDPTWDDPAT